MLQELIGVTKTQKVLDDIQKQYLEIHNKKFPNYEYIAKAMSIVSSVDKNKGIKHIGMSIPDDLFTDNFGLFLTGLIGGETVLMKDIGNVSKSYQFCCGNIVNTQSYNVTNNGSPTVGCRVQVGKGTTPATRADFNIETPFAVSPLSIRNSSGISAWNSILGVIDLASIITPAGENDSVSESCLFLTFKDTLLSATNPTLLMSRDNIDPVVPFVIGESINIDYKIVL